ncbi:MAG TPA: hypothetical protein VGL69_17770 [Solirubrobacteraceae bacterium]
MRDEIEAHANVGALAHLRADRQLTHHPPDQSEPKSHPALLGADGLRTHAAAEVADRDPEGPVRVPGGDMNGA